MAVLAAVLALAGQAAAPAPTNDMFGAFSPDGRQIAFTSDRTGDPEIFVANRDGSGVRQLTAMPGRDAHPAFSPDGRWLAFQSPRDGGDVQLYVMPAGGGEPRRVVRTTGFCGVPVWSPDGRQLVFQCSGQVRGPGSATAPWRLYLVNADGRGLRQISFGPGNDQVPVWSRDGRRLMFFSNRAGTDQLYELDLANGGISRLTEGPDTHRAASYSPDGRLIAMMKGPPEGRADVYLLDRNNGAWRRLTESGPNFAQPQFSPESATILFQAPTPQGMRLHTVPVAGGPVSVLEMPSR